MTIDIKNAKLRKMKNGYFFGDPDSQDAEFYRTPDEVITSLTEQVKEALTSNVATGFIASISIKPYEKRTRAPRKKKETPAETLQPGDTTNDANKQQAEINNNKELQKENAPAAKQKTTAGKSL